MVYIKEAHATDSDRPSDFENIKDPVTSEQRHEVCVRCVDDLGITIPAVVDDMENSVNKAYAAGPDRLYLVGKDGRVAYAGAPGPRGFSPDELERAIEKELGGPQMPGSRLMAVLDTDGDGKLSAAEIAKASPSLRKLDRNSDGELSPDELGPMPGPIPGPGRGPDSQAPRPGEMFQRLDTDGDGKLSREEFPERLRQRFDTVDADGDGLVDGEEMAAAMERRRRGGR